MRSYSISLTCSLSSAGTPGDTDLKNILTIGLIAIHNILQAPHVINLPELHDRVDVVLPVHHWARIGWSRRNNPTIK